MNNVEKVDRKCDKPDPGSVQRESVNTASKENSVVAVAVDDYHLKNECHNWNCSFGKPTKANNPLRQPFGQPSPVDD